MLRNLILLFIVLWVAVCQAQYKTLPDSAANWLREEGQPNFQPPLYYEYYLNDFKDDTLINGGLYIKLYGGTGQYKQIVGYYRSLPSGETYFIYKSDPNLTENLLFDFSKNVNDTIYNVLLFFATYPDNGIYNTKNYVVDSVSYLVHNGDSSKLMFLRITDISNAWCDSETLVWLEGVGCLGWEFFNSQCRSCSFMPLSCMSKNDTIMYKGYCRSGLDIQTNKGVHYLSFYISDMYVPGRCSIPPQSIHEEEIENKISCYPNPLQDVLNITNLPQSQNNILVLDMLGRVIYETYITGQTEAILPLQRLKKGMYILLISHKEEIVFKHKILKE